MKNRKILSLKKVSTRLTLGTFLSLWSLFSSLAAVDMYKETSAISSAIEKVSKTIKEHIKNGVIEFSPLTSTEPLFTSTVEKYSNMLTEPEIFNKTTLKTSYEEIFAWKNKIEKKLYDKADLFFSRFGSKRFFPKENALKELGESVILALKIFDASEKTKKWIKDHPPQSPWQHPIFNQSALKIKQDIEEEIAKIFRQYVNFNKTDEELRKKITFLIDRGLQIKESGPESKSTRYYAGLIALMDAKLLQTLSILAHSPFNDDEFSMRYNISPIRDLLR